MALRTAAAISALFPLSKVRVSRPRRNSARGLAGDPAKLALTAASTPAWRKIGTGCRAAGVPRLTTKVRPGSTHLAPPPIMAGRSERAGAGVGVGRGVGRGVERGFVLATTGAGVGVGFGAEATEVGVEGTGFSRAVVQPASASAAAMQPRRTLRAIARTLSCVPCRNQQCVCSGGPVVHFASRAFFCWAGATC